MSYYTSIEEQNKRFVDFQGARDYKLSKSRKKKDKRMSLPEAIGEHVKDGDIHAETGFGYVRTPQQAYFEIVRQKKTNMIETGSPMSPASYMVSFGCSKGLHLSYVGVEMRGNDKNFARMVKEKQCSIFSTWSHGAMSLGFKAAQLGSPFIACKQMLGSDMIKQNPFIKVIDNPLNDKEDPVCLIPALFPDLCIIHVQEADRYGNAVIKGPAINDIALAAACRKVIITAENIVPEMTIRDNSNAAIPFWYVDAVVELPYGSYPGSCPGFYYWNREWWEWLIRVATPKWESIKDFFDYWVFETKDQFDFIEKAGGLREIDRARHLELAAESVIDDSMVDFAYNQVIAKWD